jgi:glutaminyl-tRNA synthetase
MVQTDVPSTDKPSRNFIQQIIDADRASGKNGGRVHTRFPPEPNGYLHIGHAMSICLNFGLAQEYGGKFNLRFDDTNPTKEEQEYVDSIIDDVRWLGGDWEDRLFYASDYFPQLYEWAIQLIKDGKAYVCDLTAEEVRAHRGTLSEPGKNSPYRDRGVDENLDLFQRMEKGEFPDDRHGVAEHQSARSGDVSHQARVAPPLGRPLVHLPVVRLHARAERFDRGHHAFDLHVGI